MWNGMLRGSTVAILILSLMGCGAYMGNNNKQTDETKYKAQTYKQDGLLGITSVNPNNPLNPTYHHYEDDTNLMKAVLAQLQGIEKVSITMSGPTAKVKIKPKPELTDTQADELRSQAQMALDTNMPRYNVKVRIER
ncbi:hypothetical protein [Paenibacillus sp. N3.4]|uniref:hypothetical protein n=1 Tax=Paenibacillus sp. N3.4 TaxID=2603222 RepID=UPI0011C88C21|nr:hypothetical protein [Paenibacillus sp. N3.4]TXK73734.1 hypothetical protein FU659_30535 [Paenibacillus sp. N3.4]